MVKSDIITVDCPSGMEVAYDDQNFSKDFDDLVSSLNVSLPYLLYTLECAILTRGINTPNGKLSAY